MHRAVEVRRLTLPIVALAALGLPPAGIGPAAASSGPRPAPCAPAWTAAALPQGGRNASFYGIGAAAANDAWAVGSFYTGVTDATLAEHWDGAAWTRASTPNPASGRYLRDVGAVDPADVWAVGYAYAPGGHRTLTEHWDGSAWTVAPSPNIPGIANTLSSVDVAGPDDAWAVGSWIDTDGDYEPLVEHWDGAAWSALDVPGQEGVDDLLSGVAVAGPDDVWAVGFTSGPGGSRTLIEHWDGVAWSPVPGPNPSATANALNAVAVTSPDDV
jgi:hypothetical protein